jgi:hypothetical protein
MRIQFEALPFAFDPLPARPLMIQILTQCTASKLDRRAIAEDMYTGMQHQSLMAGVRAFRAAPRCAWCRLDVVSAKYGLVRGEDTIEPYERTFNERSKGEVRRMAHELGLPLATKRWLANGLPDLKLVLLGNEYMQACELAGALELMPLESRTVVMCSYKMAARIPDRRNLAVVCLGNAEARRHGAGLMWLKGRLAAALLGALAREVALDAEVGDDDPRTDVLCAEG